MLELHELIPQIRRMIGEQAAVAEELKAKTALALDSLREMSGDWEGLARKLRRRANSLLVAGLSGPLDWSCPPVPRPGSYTVVATDGSQVFPDRHEAFHDYLINIGSVTLSYGDRPRAGLTSTPRYFFSRRDRTVTWNGREVTVTSEAISMRREVMEIEELARLAEVCADRPPILALVDGTLILWMLEGSPEDFRSASLGAFLAAMERIRAARVPVAGYISFPGSYEVVNALRVGMCTEPDEVCARCPRGGGEPGCDTLGGVADRTIFAHLLRPGERSGVFWSKANILETYGAEHTVGFFYLNAGDEIVRVEVPAWVAEDEGLLALTHSLVLDQAKKGGGYPISLIEAHEKAVVRGRDREQFLQMLSEERARAGLGTVGSRKGISKRRPVV